MEDNRKGLPMIRPYVPSSMFWGCFSMAGTGTLVRIDGRMSSKKYIQILEENLQTSAIKLGHGRCYYFKQDNDQKPCAKVTKEWFDKKNIQVLQWPSQSPDLNPI